MHKTGWFSSGYYDTIKYRYKNCSVQDSMKERSRMGQFLNKNNRKFADFSRTKYFVDKTELINKLLEKDADEKFICNSRARRFGKSVTADMLVAYFSRGGGFQESV